MPRKKKNMASDEPVMFHPRSQNAQPQNEILCSKGLGGVALNKRFVAIWIATSIACQLFFEANDCLVPLLRLALDFHSTMMCVHDLPNQNKP